MPTVVAGSGKIQNRMHLGLVSILLVTLLLSSTASLEAADSRYRKNPDGLTGNLPTCSQLLSQTYHYFLPALGGSRIQGARGVEDKATTASRPLTAGRVTTDTRSYTATVVHHLETSALTPPSPDPAGVHFLPDSSTILIADSEVDETALFAGVNFFEVDSVGRSVDGYDGVSFSEEPTGLTYHPSDQHLYVSDDDDRKIFVVDWSQKRFEPICYIGTESFQSMDPEGIVYAEEIDALFVADGNSATVHRLLPGVNGYFDGTPPLGDDVHLSFDTLAAGIRDPEGITYDSVSGHLFLVGKPVRNLVEMTIDGDFVRLIDISEARSISPAGLTTIPGTGETAGVVLYMVDRGIDNNQEPDENDGRLFELRVPPIEPGAEQP